MDDLASIERRASRIKLLLMDCDGVLTDGRLWLTADGESRRAFNTQDGLGLSLLHRAGLKSGIITGRRSMHLAVAPPNWELSLSGRAIRKKSRPLKTCCGRRASMKMRWRLSETI